MVHLCWQDTYNLIFLLRATRKIVITIWQSVKTCREIGNADAGKEYLGWWESAVLYHLLERGVTENQLLGWAWMHNCSAIVWRMLTMGFLLYCIQNLLTMGSWSLILSHDCLLILQFECLKSSNFSPVIRTRYNENLHFSPTVPNWRATRKCALTQRPSGCNSTWRTPWTSKETFLTSRSWEMGETGEEIQGHNA